MHCQGAPRRSARIQAAQLPAELQQDIDLVQPATRLVQQRDVLQNDGCLARDLEVDLPILLGQNGGSGSVLTAIMAATGWLSMSTGRLMTPLARRLPRSGVSRHSSLSSTF